MILFKKAADLRNYLDLQASKEYRIGFVPTMGALHAGHISLVVNSRNETDLTICSLFVNPTQFNDPEDLKKYPVTTEADIQLLESNDCNILFMPSVKEMYPEGLDTVKKYELGKLEMILEGKYRPGHFQGVCRVVDRLIDIVRPQHLFLGQKDYQQCLVIKKLLDLTNRKNIQVVICPTLREPGGLAMSSRNRRLNEKSILKAPFIFQTLQEIKNQIRPGSLDKIKENAKAELQENGFLVDYIEIADAGDLETVKEWDGQRKLVALIAAFLDKVRLIDNLTLN